MLLQIVGVKTYSCTGGAKQQGLVSRMRGVGGVCTVLSCYELSSSSLSRGDRQRRRMCEML